MNSQTHMCVGAAASLALLQPIGVGATLATIAGGFLGGWISDIDVHRKTKASDYLPTSDVFLPLVVAIILDYAFHFGFCDYVISHVRPINLAGLLAFVALAIIGSRTGHRTFMHSLLAVILFSLALFAALPPVAPAFAIGMLFHVFLDLTNNLGIRLLFPLRFKLCFSWFSPNGIADRVIYHIALVVMIALGVWDLANGLLYSSASISSLIQIANTTFALGLTSFQWYIIGINALAFLFTCLDYPRFSNSATEGPIDTITIHISNFLTIGGGAFGTLVALIICNLGTRHSWEAVGITNLDIVRQGDDGNAYWYVYVLAALISWINVYFVIDNPLSLQQHNISESNLAEHIPLLLAYIAINGIAFFFFWLDRNHKRKRFDAIQFILLFTCASGGSAGGYLAMGITGKKDNSIHFFRGIPVLLIANIVTFATLVLYNIIFV